MSLIVVGLAFVGLVQILGGAAKLLPRHGTGLAALLRILTIPLYAIGSGIMVAAL